MPRQKINSLMTDLHDRFGDDLTSTQQQQLLEKLSQQINSGTELEDPSFKETLDLLLEEVEADHPQAATLVREVMDVLKNIGI